MKYLSIKGKALSKQIRICNDGSYRRRIIQSIEIW